MVERILFGPGGATEAKQDDILSAIPDSGEREFAHHPHTVTAAGDNTLITPAPGKRLRLRWIYAINQPSATSSPLISVRLGATEIYRVWALMKRQVVTGAVDAPLIVNLSEAANVAVTVIYEEI